MKQLAVFLVIFFLIASFSHALDQVGETGIAAYQLEQFTDWMKENDIAVNSKLRVGVDPLKGLGLFASEDIPKGEVLVSVPRTVTFSVRYLEDSPLTAELEREFGSDLPDETAILTFHLLHEMSHQELSFFGKWIELFPKRLESVIFWKDVDVRNLEASEDMIVLYSALRNHISQLFKKYMPKINMLELFGEKTFTEKEFRWAYMTIMVREIEFNFDGEKFLGIAPALDFINHLPGETSLLELSNTSREGGVIVLKATHDYKSGDQIYHDFGSFANHQLLLKYGFAIEDNPYDYYPIFLDRLIPLVQLGTRRRNILKRHGIDIDFDEYHLLNNDKSHFDGRLMSVLRVVFASPQELRNIEKLSEEKKILATERQMISVQNELESLKYISETVFNARQAFRTTTEMDKTGLHDPSASSVLSRRKINILIFRVGQKEMLDRAFELSLEHKQRLLAMQEGAEGQDSASYEPALFQRKDEL